MPHQIVERPIATTRSRSLSNRLRAYREWEMATVGRLIRLVTMCIGPSPALPTVYSPNARQLSRPSDPTRWQSLGTRIAMSISTASKFTVPTPTGDDLRPRLAARLPACYLTTRTAPTATRQRIPTVFEPYPLRRHGHDGVGDDTPSPCHRPIPFRLSNHGGDCNPAYALFGRSLPIYVSRRRQ